MLTVFIRVVLSMKNLKIPKE